jgi:hypothetical protein
VSGRNVCLPFLSSVKSARERQVGGGAVGEMWESKIRWKHGGNQINQSHHSNWEISRRRRKKDKDNKRRAIEESKEVDAVLKKTTTRGEEKKTRKEERTNEV